MSTANIRELISCVAFRKQADIATLPAAANFVTLSRTNSALASVDPKKEDDAQDIGKGDEFARNVYALNQDTTVTYEKYMTSQAMAYASVFGMGTTVKTSPVGSSYLYTTTPLANVASGIELPFTAYIEAIRQGGSSIVDRALVGCVVSRWGYKLNSGAGRQNATVFFDLFGSGKTTQPSGVTIPAAATEHGLNAGSAAITILTVNYISTRRLVNLEFEWQNNIRGDQGLYPGSGTDSNGFQIRGRLENGDRVATCRYQVRMESTSTELADLIAGTEGTAVITMTGALISGSTYHGFTHTLHRCQIKGAVVGDDNGILTVAVELSILYHSSNGLMTVAATTSLDNIGSAAV